MGHQNHLYVWEDRFLYLTPAIASGLTQRHTTTLLVALGEDGFELGAERGAHPGCDPGAVIVAEFRSAKL